MFKCAAALRLIARHIADPSITKLTALSAADLDAEIAEGEKQPEDAETTFKDSVKELQSTYEGLKKAHDDAIAEVKDSGLGLMKAVKAAGAKSGAAAEL